VTADVWDVYGELSSRDPASLSERQRRLVAVCDLRQELNDGGFDHYFRAGGSNAAPLALDALSRLLGPAWAALLREAMGLFGASYPADPDARGDLLDAAGLDDQLRALDKRFYELERSSDADAKLNAFIADYRDLQP